MGYYVNVDSKGKELPQKGKFQALIEDGGTEVKTSMGGGATGGFQENLICVADNGTFEAAGYCFSEGEYRVFADPNDMRLKKWLTHPKAKELSNFS